MRKSKEFEIFGRRYRTTQLAAIPALALMDKKAGWSPIDVLSAVEAQDYSEVWHRLDTPENINALVTDAAESIPPRAVLMGVVKLTSDFNFGFLKEWKGAKVPRRFVKGGASIQSKHVDPIIQTLVQDDVATVRELEEYYCLEDAFKMFDLIVVKGVNEALAHEQAEKDAKSKRH